jgi:hypothetical protein
MLLDLYKYYNCHVITTGLRDWTDNYVIISNSVGTRDSFGTVNGVKIYDGVGVVVADGVAGDNVTGNNVACDGVAGDGVVGDGVVGDGIADDCEWTMLRMSF